MKQNSQAPKTRKKNTARWVGLGFGAAAVTAAAVASHELTRFMIDMAMDRQKPKGILPEDAARQIIRGTPYQEMFLQDVEVCAEKLRNSESERVSIETSDGITLVGHLREVSHPKRIILAMHGWRSSWDQDFGMIADFWERSGCTVLYAEQRGQNDSGGDYMGFGMLERYDCLEWIDWLNERFPEKPPIYLAGVSMGATTVLMTAGLDLPPSIHGIMADCGYTSPDAIFNHVAEKNLHLLAGMRMLIRNELFRKRIPAGPAKNSALVALAGCRVPVLFVHGTADRFVPVEMTYENYLACAAPKRLLIVPGAGHGRSYLVDREGYEAAVRAFWRDFDGTDPAC